MTSQKWKLHNKSVTETDREFISHVWHEFYAGCCFVALWEHLLLWRMLVLIGCTTSTRLTCCYSNRKSKTRRQRSHRPGKHMEMREKAECPGRSCVVETLVKTPPPSQYITAFYYFILKGNQWVVHFKKLVLFFLFAPDESKTSSSSWLLVFKLFSYWCWIIHFNSPEKGTGVIIKDHISVSVRSLSVVPARTSLEKSWKLIWERWRKQITSVTERKQENKEGTEAGRRLIHCAYYWFIWPVSISSKHYTFGL